jgi:hypothetical protein
VGNVKALVRVERDGDGIELPALVGDELRQALHVGMRAGHGQGGSGALAAAHIGGLPGGGQVAKVVLRVDDQKLDVAGHGVLLGWRFQCKSLSIKIKLSRLQGFVVERYLKFDANA